MLVLTPDQRAALDAVARRWGAEAFDLFGAGLGDAFGPESDVDLLVAFRSDVRRTLLDRVSIQDELEAVV